MPKVKVNDTELYYELHGNKNSPVLILNNGVIMNAATSWIYQTAVLSKHYRLLLYDCRGQGQSEHPSGNYTMELHADDLSELMKKLKIEKAHIAGISYGGEVAQAFVLKYPSKVKSLILADTVSEVGPELRIVIESWIEQAKAQDPLGFFNATVAWNFSPEFIKANQKLIEDSKKRYAQLDFPAVVRLCECFLEVNFTEQLHTIKVPTCIIVGDKDLIKGLPYAEILRRNISQAELHIIVDAGHASCWEKAEQFNTIILGFLAKQNSSN